MSLRTAYYPGGFDPAAPNDNMSDQWDLSAGTYTQWNPDGTVLATRPLSADETTELRTLAAAQTATQSIADIYAMTQKALGDNDTYLALAAPAPADQTAQIRRLTRQVQAIARYLSTVVSQPTPSNNLADVSDVVNP